MAEKSFGIKELNLIGASGTPSIDSPNNLNLNAVNVAISTNVSIGGTLTVTGNVSVGGTLTYEDVTNIDSVGIVTAREGVFIPDNKELKIGNTASSPDLKIYHDTNHSYIEDTGTGNLLIKSDSVISIRGTTVAIKSADNSQTLIKGVENAGSELYYNGNLKFVTTNTGATVTGTLVATTFSGSGASLTSLPAANLTGTLPAISGANLTNLPADTPTNSDIQVVYAVTANGASAYRFAGNGVVSTADNPDLYLIRGQKYRFINNSGGSHPFQIRESSGGTAYSTGVTNNGASSGNIDFAPTFDSPAQLVYQCTSHGGMVGNIYLRDAAGNNTNVGVTTFTGDVSIPDTIVHSGDTDTKIRFPAADNFSIETGGSERLIINSTGKSVFKQNNGSTNNTYQIVAELNARTTGSTAANFGPALYLSHTFAGVNYAGSLITSQTDADVNTTHISFYPRNYGWTEALRITKDGIIETGTAAGASGADGNQRLRVGRVGDCNIAVRATGSTTAFTGFDFGDQDDDRAGRIQYAHDGNYMTFHTNGAGSGASNERARIDSSGNFMIGSTSAEAKLDVTGGVSISSNGVTVSPSGYDLKIRSNTGKLGVHIDNSSGTPTLEFGTGNATTGGAITTNNHGIFLKPGNVDKLKVEPDGVRSFATFVDTSYHANPDPFGDGSGIVYYRLNDNFHDSGMFAKHGTSSQGGDPTFAFQNSSGERCWNNPTDGAITIPNLKNSYPFSMAAWVNLSTWPTSSDNDLIMNLSIGGQRVSLCIVKWSDRTTSDPSIMYGGTSHWVFPASSRPTNTWIHLVYSVVASNNSGHAVYQNGSALTAIDKGGSHGGNAGWAIGGNAQNSERFAIGRIGSIRFFNKAISSSEASALYTNDTFYT